MPKIQSAFRLVLLASLLLLVGTFAAVADDAVVDVDVLSNSVQFHPLVDAEAFLLRVTGPNDFVLERVVRGNSPTFELQSDMADGAYSWELMPAPRLGAGTRAALERARRTGDMTEITELRSRGVLSPGLAQSGTVTVAGGAFVIPRKESAGDADLDGVSGKAMDGVAGVPFKDHFIADDIVSTGSLCVGFDCVNGEVFGFDTIRLKENSLRIKFEDTSGAGFPSTDWQLTANDSSAGGANKFSIDDITGGRTPFTILANAPSNSLFVDGSGRVGLGTSTPVVNLHVVSGNSPALRLEQNVSSGFAAQTWDLAGNETNFFLRDATNGSTLPLRVRPGAASNSLFINTDSKVGVGTSSPGAKLDVKISANSEVQIGENLGGAVGNDPQLRLINTGAAPTNTWSFTVQDASFVIDDEDSVGVEFQLNDSGRVRFRAANVTTFDLATNGNLTITGTLTENSDINAKENFSPVDSRTILDRVAALPISTWNYRDDGAVQMGPMAQDFFEVFGLGGTASGLAPRNLASVALAAVQGLNAEKDAEIARLEAEQHGLEARNAQLEERLAALEALVATLAGAAQ